MKTALCKFVQICLLNAFVFFALKAQTCTFFNLRLNSQSAVNAFSSTCKTINGDITVSGADITDLSPLQNIEVMNAKLTIQSNPALASLNGLHNLTAAQHLLIYNNDLLTDLTGLKKLKSVGGTTHIRYNKGLVNLAGLDSLTDANAFYISNNDSLTNLSGLGSLTNVSDVLSISANKSLTSLEGLDQLTTVSRILIGENDSLINLSGLESLTSVTYQMHISSNKSLTSLSGLTNLTYLSEAYLSDNDLMADLSGFESVRSVYWLVIGESGGLTSLNGLNNLTSATNLIIRGNESLTDLTGLENLTNVGWMQVSDNPELMSISLLGAGTNTGRNGANGRTAALTIGSLAIRDNVKLTTCAISAVCDIISTGLATFSGNGMGCENESAVQAACSPLPVTLAHFKASIENRSARLQWATTMERNSAVFDIEHSLDAQNWYRAGKQQAKGESNAEANYQWTHTSPADGLNYYRLKMIDLDGSYTYSRIESLKFDRIGDNPAIVYPNPVADVLFVENNQEITRLRIINVEGKTVYETSSVPQVLSIKNLTSGTYQLHIRRQSGVVQQKRIAIL